ncbi:hypothetical protein AC578_8503 [Pseudocercospora eumusae]|uniref:aminodeoxychorismate synthase n=1 Tax=Pseudocercospora eumusae TaxID=321146 RepID=A0A139HW82_9PEZI|nr:hypothetical protein AC578_8503 [Pseudocercospora eumusae]
MPHHRILFVDAYDSFSNSIIALLRATLPVSVECIQIDDPRFILNDEAFFTYLHGFDAVVAGPGPGHPANSRDVGLIEKLWSLPKQHVLPVLGICLGFQSLCLAFGAKVERLKEPRHGVMAIITHCGKDIYAKTGKVVATQYHSLHVNLQRPGVGDEWGAWDLWKSSEKCQGLIPLAWSLMNVANGPTLMGVRHAQKPFWGVQYHPESICTNKEGQKLVENWWQAVCDWKGHDSGLPSPIDNELDATNDDGSAGTTQPGQSHLKVNWATLRTFGSHDVATIVEMLKREDICQEPLVLESGSRGGKPVNLETGRFSIIGLPDAAPNQVRYSTRSRSLEVIAEGQVVSRRDASIGTAFEYVDEVMKANHVGSGAPNSLFWGGFIGFVSYEAGLESINVSSTNSNSSHPDLWFVFVDRSVVIDHVEGTVYIQTIREEDESWIDLVKDNLKRRMGYNAQAPASIPTAVDAKLLVGPRKDEYCSKVQECQSNLRAGESYELCLTDQSLIQTSADSWNMYKQLRHRNPAPFSAYLRLHTASTPGLSVVGSSPERFLSWSRGGKCQFRPIKGTVKKSPGVTRAKAEEMLGSAKERAENLMIVDLIRHDLAGVAGVKEVRVPKLMSVEEYETVFQLVSVVEGDMDDGVSGVSALAASLPPGSMTGAPKKRSCELLKAIERGQPRGLYSGVLGYLDVGGGGDFSVVIRTAFKWDDEGDQWRVGAGGAITALSEVEAEWEEMVTKRESVLNSLV